MLTRGEQLAEHLLHDDEVVDVAARNRGERLVEQDHPLLRAVGVDEAGAEVRERRGLEVRVTMTPSDLERLAEAFLLHRAISLEHAGVQRDPARL